MKKTCILPVIVITGVLTASTFLSGCQVPQSSPVPSAATVVSTPETSSTPAVTLVPTSKPPASPTPTPGPEVFVNESDTVAIGTVVEGLPSFQQGASVYRDWVFNVESYVVKPLPETTLKIRILEQINGFQVKGVHLATGGRLLVFLKKKEGIVKPIV